MVYDKGDRTTGVMVIFGQDDNRPGGFGFQVLRVPVVVMESVVTQIKQAQGFYEEMDETPWDLPVEANWVPGLGLKLNLGWWECPSDGVMSNIDLQMQPRNQQPLMPDLEIIGNMMEAQLETQAREVDQELQELIQEAWKDPAAC